MGASFTSACGEVYLDLGTEEMRDRVVVSTTDVDIPGLVSIRLECNYDGHGESCDWRPIGMNVARLSEEDLLFLAMAASRLLSLGRSLDERREG